MKLTFCAHKTFYTNKIETNFLCTKVIRVRIDNVGIDSGGNCEYTKKNLKINTFLLIGLGTIGFEMIVNH